MIPALLTCLYVVYLYRTLNVADETTSKPGRSVSGNAAALRELTQRLNSLEGRLQAIADTQPPMRDKP